MALKNEDIMALIAILQKGLVDDEEVPAPSHVVQEAPKASEYEQKIQRKEQAYGTRENKFLNMSAYKEHQEDIEIDKKLAKLPPTERTRQNPMIDVQCRMCGKKETVNAGYVDSPERYKCNKCSASQG